MFAKDNGTFGFVDYCVFTSMLVVSLAIGVMTSIKGNKTPEDYLLGSRSLTPIPVAMSLLTSFVSALSLLGFSGEIYAYGSQSGILIFGGILAILFCSYTTLPVLFPLKLTSVNEYIELRFKSKGLKSIVLFLSLFQGFMYLGICLYAPTIALSSVTPLNTTTFIYLLGIVCTLYSAIGGIKAVVWTDVFQLIVMMLGLCVLVFVGCVNYGGIIDVWIKAYEGSRLDLFNMKFGFYERHTFPNTLMFGFFFYAALYGTSQINVQRMSSVPDLKSARKIMSINIFGLMFIYFMILTGGLMAYATYAECDPLKAGKISKCEQILPYFVNDKLRYISGLPGLFVATLVCGTLSSLSSVISAQVSMIWKDCLVQLRYFANSSARVATFTNKIVSLIVGVILICLALVASKTLSLMQLALSVSGAANGPIFGIFMLGLLFPRCNAKGAWFGLIASWVFMCWITIGGIFYGPRPKLLPMSIVNCTVAENETVYQNFSFVDGLLPDPFTGESTVTNVVNLARNESDIVEEFKFPLMRLYSISYTFYPFIGPALCIILGLLVSVCTGLEALNNVSPDLIAPYVRKLYWTNQDLRRVLQKHDTRDLVPLTEPNGAKELEPDNL